MTGKVFANEREFQREVVDRLNSISESYGLKSHYFSHNGFTGKYCSLVCTSCQHRAYVWFDYKSTKDKTPTAITFKRNPYGKGMHRDVDKHVLSQIAPI